MRLVNPVAALMVCIGPPGIFVRKRPVLSSFGFATASDVPTCLAKTQFAFMRGLYHGFFRKGVAREGEGDRKCHRVTGGDTSGHFFVRKCLTGFWEMRAINYTLGTAFSAACKKIAHRL